MPSLAIPRKLTGMMPKWYADYGPISSAEDDEELAGGERKGFLSGASRLDSNGLSTRSLLIFTVVNAAALIVSSTLFGIWFRSNYQLPNPKLRQLHTYTPVMDRLDLPVTTQLINGTFFEPKHPSATRQMPNPAAEKVWSEWDEARVFPVSRAEIIAMGKDPETAVRLPDEQFGLGDDAYASYFDVYHQLHCLNSLRKMVYGGYYNKTTMADARDPGLLELHVNHCVDILAQAVQCSGNLNLITLHWVETKDLPWPDMSVNRKCVKFEQLTEWRLKNTIDSHHYAKVIRKPNGAKELPAPNALWNFLGKENPHPDQDDDYIL